MIQPEDIIVEVRSLALGRLGQIPMEDINDLELIKRFCNVGSWKMSLPTGIPLANELAQKGRGIKVTWADPLTGIDHVILSGGVLEFNKEQDTDDIDGVWYYQGVDDNVHLADATAWPQPSNADITTQTLGHDVRSGTAEDVLRSYVNANIGPSAPADRRITSITLGSYLGGIGLAVIGRARFDVLGQLLYELATVGGVGFDIQQVGTNKQFRVYQPSDKTGAIRMDIENDTLESTSWGVGAPTGTRALVAGQGELEDRTFVKRTSAASLQAEIDWGRKIEVFKDRRDTNVLAELNQEGDLLVAENGTTRTSLMVKPANATTMVFIRDWYLGDVVGVTVDNAPAEALVAETIIRISEDGVDTLAVLGDATGFDYESKLAAQQQQQEKRLAFLEKNVEFGDISAAIYAHGLLLTPIGTPRWALDATEDTMWKLFNGQAISRLGFPLAFAKFGTTYGIGDGSTTFNLPNIPPGGSPVQGRGDVTLGTITVDTASDTFTSNVAHNLVVGDIVYANGGVMPTGMTANQLYAVKSVPSATTFTLSQTTVPSGTLLNLTAAGSGTRTLYNATLRLGRTGGEINHVQLQPEVAPHLHSIDTRDYDFGSNPGGGLANAAAGAAAHTFRGGAITTNNGGGGLAMNNMEPFIAGNWFIRVA